MNYTPAIGDLLVRPKSFMFIDHVGVAVGSDAVFHNAPGQGERVTTMSEFAAGQPVKVLRTAAEPRSVLARLWNRLAKPTRYHATNSNCEHSAYAVVEGRSRSPQLAFIVGLLILTALAFIFWPRR
ncbi:MAG TPA: hypothetical protein VK530_10180 [Candidatus Acidoferrum sp.]|nr:hypothetical protein [Candidatus Acidoferrum sp.]